MGYHVIETGGGGAGGGGQQRRRRRLENTCRERAARLMEMNRGCMHGRASRTGRLYKTVRPSHDRDGPDKKGRSMREPQRPC